MPTSPPTMFDRSRRCHTSNNDRAAALDTFMARSHLLGRLAYRARVAVVASVGLKDAKTMSIVPSATPVLFGDRFDSRSSSTGGDESHARSSDPRRCLRLFAGASEGELTANRRQLRQGPRPASSFRATPAEQGMEAARSAAVGADIVREHRRQGWGLREARRGAPLSFFVSGASVDDKIRKPSSDAPRSAREVLDEGRDWGDKARSGAKRRCRCVYRCSESTSNVPRSALVPLAERCDAGPWRVGGDESRARSGAERRCASHFLRSFEGQKIRNWWQMRQVDEISQINVKCAEPCAQRTITEAKRCPHRASPRRNATPLCELLKEFCVLSLASHYKRSPSISSDFHKTGPALKQRINVPRARRGSFSSSATLALRSATLFELAAPLATPSILVSTNFNTPRGLGADAHHNETAFNITELV
ncbi:hypothetical protein EV714DRAFT_240403 [Schizophyllum commune]